MPTNPSPHGCHSVAKLKQTCGEQSLLSFAQCNHCELQPPCEISSASGPREAGHSPQLQASSQHPVATKPILQAKTAHTGCRHGVHGNQMCHPRCDSGARPEADLQIPSLQTITWTTDVWVSVLKLLDGLLPLATLMRPCKICGQLRLIRNVTYHLKARLVNPTDGKP